MSSDLNPLSHVVLALVGRGGASAHDLVDMLRRGGKAFWAGSPSKVYAEPKRLARLGYLAAREAPGRTRTKTVYTLTPAGERALRDWIARPSQFPRIQNEAAARVVAGDLVDDATLLASLDGLRADLAEMEATLTESRAVAAGLPHRARYLRLVRDLNERQIAAYRDWLDAVGAELGADATPAPPAARGAPPRSGRARRASPRRPAP
jgi:DNA-binding PadR family transcriptional regulator